MRNSARRMRAWTLTNIDALVITLNQSQPPAEQHVEYPIFEVLRECSKAAGLNLSKSGGDMPCAKPKVLFIEDDADTRELIWNVLTRANYEVHVAANAEHGARLAQSECFDLYVIDNWMPGTSGLDLCIRLRKLDAHTPVLIFSGAAYEEDKREAMAAGAEAYLTKPAAIDDLLAVVSGLISQARSSNSTRPKCRLDLTRRGHDG